MRLELDPTGCRRCVSAPCHGQPHRRHHPPSHELARRIPAPARTRRQARVEAAQGGAVAHAPAAVGGEQHPSRRVRERRFRQRARSSPDSPALPHARRSRARRDRAFARSIITSLCRCGFAGLGQWRGTRYHVLSVRASAPSRSYERRNGRCWGRTPHRCRWCRSQRDRQGTGHPTHSSSMAAAISSEAAPWRRLATAGDAAAHRAVGAEVQRS